MREFYAWVDETARQTGQVKADDPGTWEGTDEDPWWQQAREKRQKIIDQTT